mmetsp:Transcript_15208/g.19853  ORF Transcript_15208/g.19853 Transcript_15208/m.19853 type:complete len:312 (+) Transcript_15208:108-1043(+)
MMKFSICGVLVVSVALINLSSLPFSKAFSSRSCVHVRSPQTSSATIRNPLHRSVVLYSDLSPSDVGDDEEDSDWTIVTASEENISSDDREGLKQKMLQLCASYDRGYSASPSARCQVDDLVQQLKEVNPNKENAAAGIDGDAYSSTIPLKGIWRMIWTTAADVLTLGANPAVAPGAIYQKIEPPIATNIIDFIPRIQTLFPSSILPPSLLRAEVTTRTSSRPNQSSNRVGLTFEAVKLTPIQVLGFQNDGFLPPLSINLPQINLQDLPGVDPDGNTPGYFDVIYLDDEMLIIQQNEPGGYFVSIRVPDCDP